METKHIIAIVLVLGLLFVATLAIASSVVSAAASNVGSGNIVTYCSSEFMSVEEFFKCMT